MTKQSSCSAGIQSTTSRTGVQYLQKKNVGKRCCGAETFALAARAHEEAAYGHGREELGRDEPEDLAEEAMPDRGLRRIDRVVAILKVLQLLRWVAGPLRRSGCTSDGGGENSGVGAGRLGAAWDAACWAGCMALDQVRPGGSRGLSTSPSPVTTSCSYCTGG